jgi:murein DD-endopeptidase MepM/ murein hydrolase activator NlpD
MLDRSASRRDESTATDDRLDAATSPARPAPEPHGTARSRRAAARRAATVRWMIALGVGCLVLVAVVGWSAVRPSHDDAMLAPAGMPSRLAGAWDLYPESGTPMPEAVAFAGHLAEFPEPDAAEPAAPEPIDASLWAPYYETLVRLEKGDTVARVLHGIGLAADAGNAISALESHVKMNRLRVGQALRLRIQAPDEVIARPVLLALTIRPDVRREITIERDDDGRFGAAEKEFEIVAKRQRAAGMVDGSVIASAEAAGVPRRALAEMLRAFSWDVNFQHDIKVGDRFDMLIEQSWTSDGRPADGGRVLWAELTTNGGARSFAVYRFKPRSGTEFFYNRKGESVVKALLRTPLNMSRVSSRFGMRRHPVLGFTRLHAGVDFAAPTGTPILAAGAGRIVEAGRNGGYGRWVKISHDGGLSTGYAHMSSIARGIRRSARVRQGQVIGYVGSTGLSTGPHLHFELHRRGRPVDPLKLARTALRTRLAGQELARFRQRVAELDRARETAAVSEQQPDETMVPPDGADQ